VKKAQAVPGVILAVVLLTAVVGMYFIFSGAQYGQAVGACRAGDKQCFTETTGRVCNLAKSWVSFDCAVEGNYVCSEKKGTKPCVAPPGGTVVLPTPPPAAYETETAKALRVSLTRTGFEPSYVNNLQLGDTIAFFNPNPVGLKDVTIFNNEGVVVDKFSIPPGKSHELTFSVEGRYSVSYRIGIGGIGFKMDFNVGEPDASKKEILIKKSRV